MFSVQTKLRKVSITWFGFGEASSHGGPRIEGRPGRAGGREGGEGGVLRELRSDPRAGLLGGEETITRSSVSENLQVQAGHRTRQLLHITCTDKEQHLHTQNHTNQTGHIIVISYFYLLCVLIQAHEGDFFSNLTKVWCLSLTDPFITHVYPALVALWLCVVVLSSRFELHIMSQ